MGRWAKTGLAYHWWRNDCDGEGGGGGGSGGVAARCATLGDAQVADAGGEVVVVAVVGATAAVWSVDGERDVVGRCGGDREGALARRQMAITDCSNAACAVGLLASDDGMEKWVKAE